jgi:hypothetical protein
MKLFRYLDFITESTAKIILPVVFSDEFKDKLDNIGHSFISSSFKELYGTDVHKEYTLISLGNTDDTISYTDSYKLSSYKGDIRKIKSTDELWKKNRTDIKVGRFVQKFFPNTFTDKAIEDFVNKWKSSVDDNSRFEMYTGRDIKNAYRSNLYYFDDNGRNPLINSCMNDELNLVEFYSFCPGCSILVLINSNDEILGRALVWVDHMNRTIMDRVYYVFDKDYYRFVRYAQNNGWYYKKRNLSGTGLSFRWENSFVKDGEEKELLTKVRVPDVFKFRDDGFPYMDTFYYAQGEWAYNYEPEGSYFKLQDTDGGYEEYLDEEYENDN